MANGRLSSSYRTRKKRPEKCMSHKKLALLIKLYLNRKTSTRNSWPPSGTANFSMYGLAGDQGNNGADMQPGGKKTNITNGLRLGSSEVLRSSRHHQGAQSQRHHSIDRVERRGERRGNRERSTIFLEWRREGRVERTWALPNA